MATNKHDDYLKQMLSRRLRIHLFETENIPTNNEMELEQENSDSEKDSSSENESSSNDESNSEDE